MDDENEQLDPDQEQPEQDDRYSPSNKSSNNKGGGLGGAAKEYGKDKARQAVKKQLTKQLAKQAAKRGAEAAAGAGTAGVGAVAIEAADQARQFLKDPEVYIKKWIKRILLILLAIFLFIMIVAIVIAAILGLLSQDTKGVSISKTGPQAVKNSEDIKYKISLTKGGGGSGEESTGGGGDAQACGSQKSNPPGKNEPNFSCSGGPSNTSAKPSSDNYYITTKFGCNKGFPKDSGDNCIPGCLDKIPECKGIGGRACEEKIEYYAANAGIYGCNARLKVTNPKTGQAVIVSAIDYGPGCQVQSGRQKFDISQKAMKTIGDPDGQIVKVEKVPDNSEVGPVKACGAGDGGQTPNPKPQESPKKPNGTTRSNTSTLIASTVRSENMSRAVLQAKTGPDAKKNPDDNQNPDTKQNKDTKQNPDAAQNTNDTADTGGGGAASWDLVLKPNDPDSYVLNMATVMVLGDTAYAVDTIPENATFVSATGEYELGSNSKTVTWKVPVASIPGGGGGGGEAGAGGDVTIGNLTLPPGAKAVGQGYYRMPESKDGSYKLLGSCHTGSKELVSLLYTVAQAWKKKHAQGHINIGDMNAPGHLSHKNGIDVDLEATSDGSDCVADYSARGLKGLRTCSGKRYNRKGTIELGKMFMESGLITFIFYNDAAARAGIGSPAKVIWQANHENHFHVRINKGKLGSKGC